MLWAWCVLASSSASQEAQEPLQPPWEVLAGSQELCQPGLASWPCIAQTGEGQDMEGSTSIRGWKYMGATPSNLHTVLHIRDFLICFCSRSKLCWLSFTQFFQFSRKQWKCTCLLTAPALQHPTAAISFSFAASCLCWITAVSNTAVSSCGYTAMVAQPWLRSHGCKARVAV